jgi:peptidyl-prolyl cis-trans isomerase SurA
MKKIFKMLIGSLLCLFLSLGCGFIQAKPLEKIVAIVNDDVITQSEFNRAFTETQRQIVASRIDTHLSNTELKKHVLDNLILEKLQLQMAKRAGLTASEADINRAIANIAKRNNLSTQQFKDVLEKEGIDFKTYKEQISKQVLIAHLQQEAIAPSITVTPRDIQKFNQEYAQHQKGATEYRLETIVIPFLPASEMSLDNQFSKAKALRVALQKKTTLKVAAQTVYGEKIADELALRPTQLGSNPRADLPNLFQTVVPTMRVGGYAGPIKAPNGFHILHLLGKNEKNKTLSREQVTQLIFQEKFNEALENWLKELRSSAYVKIMNQNM